jgi:tRNA modification GTPase
MIPSANDLPLRAAQRSAIETAADALSPQADPLILAEQLRLAARSLARILGIDATEAMLDQLFGRFCLGK